MSICYYVMPGLKKKLMPLEKGTSIKNVDDIIDTVCVYFGKTKEQIFQRRRDRPFLYPKQVIVYLLKKYTRLTYFEISNTVGCYHHTTAMHTIKHIEYLMYAEDAVRNDIEKITKLLY